MILDCNFFCRTPEEWTAFGTFVLCIATIALWVTAFITYRDQRRTTLILQRPILAVIEPVLGVHPVSKVSIIAFNFKNIGKSPAFDLRVSVRYILNFVEQTKEETNEIVGNLSPDDSFGIAIPLKINLLAPDNYRIPLSFVAEFYYNDLEKEGNKFTYVAEYNWELMYFIIGRRSHEFGESK